ncbi:carbohydrate ABC transporter permease [Bacillus aquiflavi]|uniref:Carbohydrate ABC transporter permease n=1 Tax=Bacillus aquiflavi TaxID=2672567 RepID=A0A6B3VXR8_9BACI|nr:carbohydrate ABC transporter permease [Bacillus aquiflavi]MBA4537832.1 carbohydrate ABC transporter permease [Bacillus aquiflavi]NEY82088.1 carbohydrate ABC transporter permease [Bacillus aquiflavi]
MNRLLNISTYVLAILWAFPLFWLVITAFKPGDQALELFSFSFSLNNFISAWNSAPFLQYYLNTFIIVTVVLVVQLMTATLAAYAFARLSFKGKNAIFILFLVQIMIPVDLLIFPNYGILSDLHLVDSKLGMMLPYFASAFGIFLLRQIFKSIPYELEEAARMDGCNLLQIIWHVYVPLAKPTYIAFGLISVSHQWSNFLWPLVVTNSVENRPLTVGLSIFAKSFETGAQWGEVSAATLFVIFPLLLAFFIFQKQFVESFMHTGIK